MNPLQAAAPFPFPRRTMETFLELHRKNAAALTNVNQVAFEGLTTVAQRQSDLLKRTVDDCGDVIGDVLAAASLKEKAARQADGARQVYDSSITGFCDLCDIATKANVAAFEILNTRIAEAIDEFNALLRAPVEVPPPVIAAPPAVIAAPVTEAEVSAEVEDDDVHAEPEPPVKSGAGPGGKPAAGGKAARRAAPRR